MDIKKAVVKLLKEYVILEKIKDDFEVLPTTKEEAEPFVMRHYLEKFPTGIKRIYGIYQKLPERHMVGVIIYGVPFMTAAKFLEPEVKLSETLELKRLFIDDLGIKNLESYVIGQSLKLLKKDEPQVKIVITFADDRQGHKGIIYQATNAIYIGSSGGKHKYLYIIGGNVDQIKSKVRTMIQQYPKQNINESIDISNTEKFYKQKNDIIARLRYNRLSNGKIKKILSKLLYNAMANDLKNNYNKNSLEIDMPNIIKKINNISNKYDTMPSTIEWKRMSPDERDLYIKRGAYEHEWLLAKAKDEEDARRRLKLRQSLSQAGMLQYDEDNRPMDTNLWTEKEWDEWNFNIPSPEPSDLKKNLRQKISHKTGFNPSILGNLSTDLPSNNYGKPARKYPLDMYSYDDGSTDYRLSVPSQIHKNTHRKKKFTENYYTDVGHNYKNENDRLWFWNEDGNLVVKKAIRHQGHLAYPLHNRCDYEGRFDADKNTVSIVDMHHYNHMDDQGGFGYDVSNDISRVPQELIQLLKFEFGDDIKMKIFY